MVIEMRAYHVATYPAGHNGYLRELRPDHWEVRHDSKRYVYERPSYHGRPLYGPREARAFIAEAWGARGQSVRIKGRWPSYHVETES